MRSIALVILVSHQCVLEAFVTSRGRFSTRSAGIISTTSSEPKAVGWVLNADTTSFVGTTEPPLDEEPMDSIQEEVEEEESTSPIIAEQPQAPPEATIEEEQQQPPLAEATVEEAVVGTDVIENDEVSSFDSEQMRLAIQMAQSNGGERGSRSPFPKPISGAVIVTSSGKILGKGRSDYNQDAVEAAIRDAGLEITALREWVVQWPTDPILRQDIADATLYVTLEPSNVRKGEVMPPMTQLIEASGIPRVVIGCPQPIQEYATKGAGYLHSVGVIVSLGVEQEDCEQIIAEYSERANSKLQRMARKHYEMFGRPLGFLHCSVVNTDNVEAYARQGNAFGKDFGGQRLSFRDFGSYGIAPPPELVWAGEPPEDDMDTEIDNFFDLDFEEEESQDGMVGINPMMPWYEQVDAVVGTFARKGNGPKSDIAENDDTVKSRLSGGLKWLATQGESLPANVERVLVMDATDLKDLPLTNDDPNLPDGVDIEQFWKAEGRKPTRILLRRGENAQAQAAAQAAADAAAAAAKAAQAAVDAIESGEAERAAESAMESQQAAVQAAELIQKHLSDAQELKRRLMKRGVGVDTLSGSEPVDVMKYLGQRNGYNSVVWRAGCWGERGVKAIKDGAFQWVSAHLAVDAVGGRFWQLMLAERAVQAACGPERKVKVFADQEDISLEYCDEAEADSDCVLTVDGQPVRHVRLDCRVALVDDERPREFVPVKTTLQTKKTMEQDAPWFL
eukprot:CAMPEP_0194028860 /NCGR_PEP_ID=MMETSP0009_2-20130614/2730_1 /TAXON_ID=210454 /ORGANISM="Grammatophora oceanica, Strain CCMP 410" /LENGTH=732 /DNA_ID=CAMNT_0038668371 /DNA_START=18 /DNA_END=2216 /DNA_ORIENTATION=+